MSWMSDSSGLDLCAFPAASPPDGVVPNFVDPESLATTTLSVGIILTSCAVFVVAARLYMNWGKLNWADHLMAVGAAFDIAYTGLLVSLYPYNRHQWDVPACWMNARQLQIIFAHTTIVGLVLLFPKCAILLMYRQLFRIHRWIRVSVWAGIVFGIAIYVPSIPLAALFDAPKVGQTWEEELEYLATTGDKSLIYWGPVQGSCSVLLDLFIFFMPIPVLNKLQLPLKKKIQLFALFATALFGVAASVIALVFRIKLLSTHDSTWHQAELALCVFAENNTAILVGCMPAFAKFVKFVGTTIASRRSRSTRSLLHGSGEDSDKQGSWPMQMPPPLPRSNGTTWSSARKHPLQHDNFTDTMLLQTQVSIAGDGQQCGQHSEQEWETGIRRTTDIHQQEARAGVHVQSVEHFV